MINRNILIKKTDIRKFTFKVGPEEADEIQKILAKYSDVLFLKIDRPISPGTEEQNRTMHALLQAYYVTGMHSAPEPFNKSLAGFKIWIKSQYGPCYYYDMDNTQVRVPKSWADYTRSERMNLIDGLISEIKQSNAHNESDKIREILNGMEQ